MSTWSNVCLKAMLMSIWDTRRIHLVRGKDKGGSAWRYVMVERSLLGLFLKQTNGGTFDVADFHIALKSSGGRGNPPESTREGKLCEFSVKFQLICILTL